MHFFHKPLFHKVLVKVALFIDLSFAIEHFEALLNASFPRLFTP